MAIDLSYEDIKENRQINEFIRVGDESIGFLGYTEHSRIHAGRVAHVAGKILNSLSYGQRLVELAKMASYMHDMGNVINRVEHARSGALLAFNILTDLEMDPSEIAKIVAAIGNHHEEDGCAVSPVSAALIIADKADVRRSRVKNSDIATFDIHDRVNYAIGHSKLEITNKNISLILNMDTAISSPMEYLEIFMNRMTMSRKAARFLGKEFELIINGGKLL